MTGANTNSVGSRPDGTQLYVTNGNLNSVAVVALTERTERPGGGSIPTGWYPNSVSFSPDGNMGLRGQWQIADGSESRVVLRLWPGQVPKLYAMNEYNPQLTKAGLQSFPTATLATQLLR